MVAYRIKFKSNKSFVKGFKYLLTRGFLFTNLRYKKYSESFNRDDYIYIFVGHKLFECGCKMVMNTGPNKYPIFNGNNELEWIEISLTKFVKQILPTW
jgi:hypothetical protein